MSVQKVLKDLRGRARNYRPIKEPHSFSAAQPKALKIVGNSLADSKRSGFL